MTCDCFQTSLEHVTAELERMDVLIRAQYLRAKHLFENKGEYHGLYISDHDVETLLANPLAQPLWSVRENDSEGKGLAPCHETLGRAIQDRVAESGRQGIRLRLDFLARIFNFTRFDVDILLVCLAPELNSSYEKIYAYLQDDATRKRPTVDLVLHILGSSFQEKMDLRKRLRSGSPLVDQQIVHVTDDPSRPSPFFITRCLHVDERIVSYLLDEDVLHEDLKNLARLVDPVCDLDALVFPEKTICELTSARNMAALCRPMVFYFYGSYGSGKKSAAEAICRCHGRRLLIADLEKILGEPHPGFQAALAMVLREAVLQEAWVYWDKGDALFFEDKSRQRSDFMMAVIKGTAPCFIGGSERWEPRNHLGSSVFISVEFPLPSCEMRVDLWSRHVRPHALCPDVDILSLASAFVFSGGQIRDAVQSARNLMLKQDGPDQAIRSEDLKAACLLQSSRKLSTLARKLKPSFTWDDVVLPEDRLEQLKDIVNHMRYRSLVFESWGFGRKLSYGKGLNVLFAGPSGTGKTMPAEIMAGDLGLDLYKVDLARVVSKYIGETEKNLSKIFHEAETSNAILFFDEADAIFGKRSEVHDAHDRYANIETSYLLQRMEEYEGMTILATNFRRNMDEAFVRRIQYAIEFPFPGKQDRKQIWQKTWPREIPLARDIDFEYLAGRFEMSGGNIRNICLNAAFIAAADGRTVTMNHLIKATRGEYRKMGKLMMGHEFTELRAHSPAVFSG